MTSPHSAPLFKPRRLLGKTDFVATQLGIGDVADRQLPDETLVSTLHRAMDAGLNVIDTAPAYEDGYSEEVVGRALHGRRGGMFVIDKVDHFEEPIAPQIEGSLRRLKLDHVDLFALHGLSSLVGWERATSPGGAFDQMERCRQAGKLRYIGISSHHPAVLREAILSGLCDVMMFPIGAAVELAYVTEILPLAREHGLGTICFKTFGAGKLLGDTPGYNQPLELEALRARPRGKFSSGGAENPGGPQLPHMDVRECLHYTLTCDPDVALLGLSFPNEQDAAFAAALAFERPLPPAEMARIRLAASEAIEDKGHCWWNPDPRRYEV